ncbi:MAG: acyltransferase family protein [Chloroflexi bacterium]|nr:acyltransferase family protein [Chloroflexota bacterium]
MGSQQSVNTEVRNSIQWVDFARFIGAFLVVLAHITGWGTEPSAAGAFYYTVSRVGVPIFFLISGYLLLTKEEDLWTFFKKRAARILIPFLAWSILYDVLNSQAFAETGVTLEAVLKMFIRILRGPREGHLWFFYSLIGLYLLTPILRVFVAKAKPSELFYYIALWFLVAPVLYIVEGLTPLKNGFEVYYTGGYVGYFLLGFYLGKHETTPRLVRFALAVFLAGFLFSFAVFHFDLPPHGNELPFRSYPSLNIILMSLGAFVLVKAIGEKAPAPLLRFSGWVSGASFGIYLVHPLILRWMTAWWVSLGFDPAAGNSLFVLPVVALILFLLSWLLVFLVGKAPMLRSVV